MYLCIVVFLLCLAVFDLLGALVIWTVLQNKPAIEVAQESHNDPAPQH